MIELWEGWPEPQGRAEGGVGGLAAGAPPDGPMEPNQQPWEGAHPPRLWE